MFLRLTGWVSFYRLVGPMMPTFLNETNPSCMDAVLDAALAFADRGPCDASAAEAQAPVVIAKAFGGRPATVNRGKEVLMKMMEVSLCQNAVPGRRKRNLYEQYCQVWEAGANVIMSM